MRRFLAPQGAAEPPFEEPVILPDRPLAEIEEELTKIGRLAKRVSCMDLRWAPFHAQINELLDEWEATR